MHDYYWRGDDDTEEVIIQATGNIKCPLSIRVTEADEGAPITAMVNLPLEEIDRIIEGLQQAKRKILSRR